MIAEPSEDVQKAFIHAVRQWFRLLSQEEWQKATAFLDEPNSYGILWDEKQIRDVLADYAGTDSWHVTDPDKLAGDGRPSGGEFNDKTGFWFELNVPLDGEWSDLTAQFEFLRRPNGLAVVLHDIHVL